PYSSPPHRPSYLANAVVAQSFETLQRDIRCLGYFVPSLGIRRKWFTHQGRTIGHVVVSGLTIHRPAINATPLLLQFNDTRNAIAPLRSRHAAKKIISVESRVGVGAD